MATLAVVAHGAGDLRVESRDEQALGPGQVEVGIEVGGICGSDLHYFHRGGVGDFRIREPLVLGHEVAGRVTRLGPEVAGVEVGRRVAIDPSAPCGACGPCRRGARNLCADVRFLGSAARFPHAQGAFRERAVVGAEQCLAVPENVPLEIAVFAEPLAVAFHAVGRAGPVLGRRVLITGAGPIGLLIALVAVRGGAAAVTVTDVVDAPLELAGRIGVTDTVNVASGTQPPPADIALEASGAPDAVRACVEAVGPGGRVVLVGMLPPGLTAAPVNRVVTHEVDLVGSFRFIGDEFAAALGALADGLDVEPLLTGRYPAGEAVAAFEAASRREESMKVQLVFGGP